MDILLVRVRSLVWWPLIPLVWVNVQEGIGSSIDILVLVSRSISVATGLVVCGSPFLGHLSFPWVVFSLVFSPVTLAGISLYSNHDLV